MRNTLTLCPLKTHLNIEGLTPNERSSDGLIIPRSLMNNMADLPRVLCNVCLSCWIDCEQLQISHTPTTLCHHLTVHTVTGGGGELGAFGEDLC